MAPRMNNQALMNYFSLQLHHNMNCFLYLLILTLSWVLLLLLRVYSLVVVLLFCKWKTCFCGLLALLCLLFRKWKTWFSELLPALFFSIFWFHLFPQRDFNILPHGNISHTIEIKKIQRNKHSQTEKQKIYKERKSF